MLEVGFFLAGSVSPSTVFTLLWFFYSTIQALHSFQRGERKWSVVKVYKKCLFPPTNKLFMINLAIFGMIFHHLQLT